MSEQSGCSHSSQTSSRSRYVCKCGLDAPLMTAWTDANPGRRFYGCGMYKIQGYKKCTHFAWQDWEMNARAKELISSLLKNLNEEKDMVKTYKAKEDELKLKVKILKKQLRVNWILFFVMLLALVATTLTKYGANGITFM